MTRCRIVLFCFSLSLRAILGPLPFSCGFIIQNNPKPRRTISTTKQHLSPITIDSYEKAFRSIDDCAISGEPTVDLYEAAHFIEKNAYKIYPDLQSKLELWSAAHGSWKLQFSTGGAKQFSFHKPPKWLPFSFATIDDNHFGNGIGLNEKTIWLSFLHNQYFHAKQRRMVVTLAGAYVFGKNITTLLPRFIRQHFDKVPEDYTDKDPPTFVLIGCSEHALIARGNQSGGLAIWTRLPEDIREVAYQEVGEWNQIRNVVRQ